MLEVGKETFDVWENIQYWFTKLDEKFVTPFLPQGLNGPIFHICSFTGNLLRWRMLSFSSWANSAEKQLPFEYTTHTTTTMAKLIKVFIKPSNFQTILLTLLVRRHIFNCLSKGKVIPRFWKTHSHTLPLKGPLSLDCPSFSTWKHLGSKDRKVFSHSRRSVARES